VIKRGGEMKEMQKKATAREIKVIKRQTFLYFLKQNE
jgi:hypothetical protein